MWIETFDHGGQNENRRDNQDFSPDNNRVLQKQPETVFRVYQRRYIVDRSCQQTADKRQKEPYTDFCG